MIKVIDEGPAEKFRKYELEVLCKKDKMLWEEANPGIIRYEVIKGVRVGITREQIRRRKKAAIAKADAILERLGIK